MKWDKVPLFDGLEKFVQKKSSRFHVPGHKGAHFIADYAKNRFSSIMEIDLTELTGLDDLAHPEGIIAEAEELAAACFEAEKTYFLVGGSTLGNLAMIMSTISKDEKVIVQRNSHKSIYNALAMVGAEVLSIEPSYEENFQIPMGIEIEQIKREIGTGSKLKAIILTTPNYYGVTYDIREIVQMAHEQNIIVLVDEAHGAHLGRYKNIPLSAMQMGADCSVQSTHKMLGAMTMSSMLHIQGNRVNKKDIEVYINMLQSSSPSYPLLVSLDIARHHIQQLGEEEWEGSMQAYHVLREAIDGLDAYHILSSEIIDQNYIQIDPYKLVLQPKWPLSGYELQKKLEEEEIYIELADPINVVLTLPIITHSVWNKRLITALKKIAQEKENDPTCMPKKITNQMNVWRTRYSALRVYQDKEKEEIPLVKAAGRRIAEMIIPYPPGVPLLIPGEFIHQRDIDNILYLRDNGTYFQGKKNKFHTIQVLK